MRQLARPIALALLSAALAAVSAQAAEPAVDPIKQRLCRECAMPKLPLPLPRRGIVLSLGSFLADGSTWYVADFERAEATRVYARMDRASGTLRIAEQLARPLPPAELAGLTQLAERIWANKGTLPTHMATDVVWDMWLLDGGDTRHEFAPGRPDGLAREVEQAMRRVVEL